jgi:hypothetical protein
MNENVLVGRHELQLIHEPEHVSEQKGNGEKERVGNHLWPAFTKV